MILIRKGSLSFFHKRIPQLKEELISIKVKLIDQVNVTPPNRSSSMIDKKSKPLPQIKENEKFEEYGERVSEQVITNIANNEKVQEKVGQGIAKLASNQKVQEKVSDSINNLAKDEKVKRGIGNTIAGTTDNQIVKTLATNEKIQDTISFGIQKTVGIFSKLNDRK